MGNFDEIAAPACGRLAMTRYERLLAMTRYERLLAMTRYERLLAMTR